VDGTKLIRLTGLGTSCYPGECGTHGSTSTLFLTTTRFLNLRILIHRRFASLWRPLPPFGDPEEMCIAPIDNALYATSLDLCRSAAIKLVGAVSDNYVSGLPGAWWAEMNCKHRLSGPPGPAQGEGPQRGYHLGNDLFSPILVHGMC
jgi:hypothetical protein